MRSAEKTNVFNRTNKNFITPGLQLKMIAEAKPDEDAIIQENIDGDVRKISWRSFEETTNRLAWM